MIEPLAVEFRIFFEGIAVHHILLRFGSGIHPVFYCFGRCIDSIVYDFFHVFHGEKRVLKFAAKVRFYFTEKSFGCQTKLTANKNTTIC
jgi:hypothetical protein